MMDYIRSFLSFAFAVCMMYTLLDCELRSNKKRIILLVFVTFVFFADLFVLYHYGYGHFMKLYPLFVHLPTFLAFIFVSKFKPVKVFFILITLVALSISFSLTGLIISYFFNSSREVVNIVSYVLYLPAGLIVYRYVRQPFLYMMRNTDKGWLGFSIIPLTYSVLIYSIGLFDLNNVNIEELFKNAILLCILTLSAYSMILRFFKQTREQLTLQNEQNMLKTQITAAKFHLEALKESHEKTMIYRHDMRHHLNMINAYLTDNNVSGAQNYIINVEELISDAVVEQYCNNYAVNLIISSYIAKAGNEDIKVEARIDLNEDNNVSDMDLCILFSNAIENAVNACKRIEREKDRILKIVCRTINDQIFIQITNSCDDGVIFADKMPVCTEEGHGIGTKSIAAITQKYNGTYSFSAENGIFKTSIIV